MTLSHSKNFFYPAGKNESQCSFMLSAVWKALGKSNQPMKTPMKQPATSQWKLIKQLTDQSQSDDHFCCVWMRTGVQLKPGIKGKLVKRSGSCSAEGGIPACSHEQRVTEGLCSFRLIVKPWPSVIQQWQKGASQSGVQLLSVPSRPESSPPSR